MENHSVWVSFNLLTLLTVATELFMKRCLFGLSPDQSFDMQHYITCPSHSFSLAKNSFKHHTLNCWLLFCLHNPMSDVTALNGNWQKSISFDILKNNVAKRDQFWSQEASGCFVLFWFVVVIFLLVEDHFKQLHKWLNNEAPKAPLWQSETSDGDSGEGNKNTLCQ